MSNLTISEYFSDIVSQIDYETELLLFKLAQFRRLTTRTRLFDATESEEASINGKRKDLLERLKRFELECYASRIDSPMNQIFLQRTIFYLSQLVNDFAMESEEKFVVLNGICLSSDQIALFKERLLFGMSRYFLLGDSNQQQPENESERCLLNRFNLFMRHFFTAGSKFISKLVLSSLNRDQNLISFDLDADFFHSANNEINLFKCNIERVEAFTFSGSFDNIKLLDLSFNKLKRLEANTFVGLRNLEILGLNNNQLSRLDPNAFDGLVRLQRLYLNRNELTHLTSDQFGQLSNLVELNLAQNKIKSIESADSFRHLVGLKCLSMKSNRLSGHVSMSLFEHLKSVNELDLSNNQLESIDFLMRNNNLCNLSSLNLSHNQLMEIKSTKDSAACLSSLLKLNLASNQLNLKALANFNLINLKWINFTGNQEENDDDDAIKSNSSFIDHYLSNNFKNCDYFLI